MAQIQSKKIAGGLYVCSRCDETFSSITELRAHEKLCQNSAPRTELREEIAGKASGGEGQHSREA
ncbi:MAG: hypothetical protein ACRD22_04900 [Terriglobia bacterium]